VAVRISATVIWRVGQGRDESADPAYYRRQPESIRCSGGARAGPENRMPGWQRDV